MWPCHQKQKDFLPLQKISEVIQEVIFLPSILSKRDALWRKIRDMADLGPKRDKNGLLLEEGLNFHDSRATFATWAASIDPVTNKPRLDVLALAKQTGHRDLAMLQRYYRANSSVIAGRLDAAIEHDNMVNKRKGRRE